MKTRASILFALLGASLAPPAHAGTWSTRTAGGMNTRVYLPETAGAVGTGRSLLIVLHGCTQTNDALQRRGNLEPAADGFGMVVAVPQVPNGGVLAGCWDYYGANHSRTTRHSGPVLDLVAELLSDAALGIDEAQVYVAGLSSGAGQAAVLGCLAPDVFAGVGINAGPAVGTTQSQFATVGTTAERARGTCTTLAGGQAPALATQVVSLIAGDRDFIVAQGYLDVNEGAYTALAAGGGAALTEASLDVAGLPGFEPAGQGAVWSDATGPRVSKIVVSGMGHAFPAGSGDGFELEFVATKGPAWPEYLAAFFSENNPRVVAAPPPDAGMPPTDAGVGTDAGAPGSDAGAGPTDGGVSGAPDAGATGEGPDAAGCRCAAPVSQGGLQTFALFALVGLGARRRRLTRP